MTGTLVRPTRRTLVRSAAWSVPVVSLAATAPAFAASKKASSGLTSTSTAEKWSNGNEKHVSWDLTLTNGDVAITSISIVFSYAPNSGSQNFTAFEIYGYTPPVGPRDSGWTGSGSFAPTASVTSVHGAIAANSTTYLHTDFAGGDNAAGTVKGVATVTYADGTTVPYTLGPVAWGSGSQHTHPLV